MREYDAYLFDADGTLMDTRELINRSYTHAIGAVGLPVPDRAAIEATTGLAVQYQLRKLIGDQPEELYERTRTIYGDYMNGIYAEYLRIFPGVVEVLAELRRRGKKLAVVTSRRRPSLELFLGTLGIGDCFDVMVTPEDTEKHKPDPEPARLAMRLLDAKPEDTVFIGDAEFDVLCGKGAGTDAVLVSWSGMDSAGWAEQPDVVIDGFRDLLPGKGDE